MHAFFKQHELVEKMCTTVQYCAPNLNFPWPLDAIGPNAFKFISCTPNFNSEARFLIS